MGNMRAANKYGGQTKKGSEKMSKIVEKKDSQHLIDVEERKVVFEDGYEIHTVTVRMGDTQFQFKRHLDEGNIVSKNQFVDVFNMGTTEIKIFEKVKKNATRFPTFVSTSITGLKA